MLNWALRYQKMGLSVIPITPKGKEPLIPWKEFQQKRAIEQEIRSWWTKYPTANVGVVTGQISNLVIVDLDGQEGLEQAKHLQLNSSVVSITGLGKHLWYRIPMSDVANAVKIYPGIDIRGTGGFVVAPPSIHENGKRYRFITALTNVAQLPLFPAALILKQPNNTANGLNSIKKEGGWIAKALEDLKDGNIDNTFTSILGRLRYDGWTSSDAKALLIPHAKRVKAEDGHLEAKIENIWNRYQPRQLRSGIDLYRPTEQSVGGLVIHSPTNPDSIKQFEQCKLVSITDTSNLWTGYTKLDAMCNNGLKSSRLFTIAARTGTGKTNWILGCAKYLCEAGKKVLLFSTEMPYTEIWARYKAMLKTPTDFNRHEFFVCDSFAPNLEKVEEAINTIKPDVFIFDHINHVSEGYAELGQFMQGLNYLRRKYDCAGIVTAQLNRSADWIDLKTNKKVEPRMSMIKGSGTIEQASSRVLLLSETRVTPECTEIVGVLDKNDNGTKGLVNFGLYSNPWRMEEI